MFSVKEVIWDVDGNQPTHVTSHAPGDASAYHINQDCYPTPPISQQAHGNRKRANAEPHQRYTIANCTSTTIISHNELMFEK